MKKAAIYPMGILIGMVLITLTILAGAVAAKEDLIVPFNIDRNKVIIPTSVNGSPPLLLILDTGMGFDGVYLFHNDALGLIDTTGAIEVRVPGAGSGEASKATMIETGRIGFGDVTVGDQRVIVSHSEHTQSFPTDGVIGWNLFGHYIVEIDYDSQRIFLHDTTYAPPDSGWTMLPVELRNNLPFFDVTVQVIAGEVVPMQVYIDLASGDALELLVHPKQKFTMPKDLTPGNLGTGLSGDINGYSGRSVRMQIGGYELHDIRTSFAPAKVRSKQGDTDGILGDDLIRRFNIIFDYPHSRLYIRPNKTFELPFE
jgi:hypothetical protein